MIWDEKLGCSALEISDAMVSAMPEPEDCPVDFSEEFHRKMKRVIRRGSNPIPCRLMRRAAVVALVIFFGFSMVMAVNAPFRESVFQWIKETSDGWTSYQLPGQASIMTKGAIYEITALGDEFVLVESHRDSSGQFDIYKTSDGQSLHFSTVTHADASNMVVITEGTTAEQVSINGNVGDLYLSDEDSERNALVWCDRETGVMFWLACCLDREEMIALAESVERIK